MSDKAEKPEKKSEPAAAAEAAKPAAGGMLSKTPVLVGAVMLIEAVVLFAGFKFVGGSSPHKASAADTGATLDNGKDANAANADKEKKRPVEVPVVDFRAPNRRGGQTYLYDVTIVAVTKASSAEQVKKIFADRENLIRDKVRTIIAESDPDKLGGGSEPGLETLRRQVKFQLDEIVGEGLIEEVLVPKCIPFRTDF